MTKHLTTTAIDLGSSANAGDGDPGRTGGGVINTNASNTETAVNALAGRHWLTANTARSLALGDRVQSDNHAGITHTLPGTFVYDAEGLNDIWVINHDDTDDLTISPDSGFEIFQQGTGLGAGTTVTLSPGQMGIFSIRVDSTSWNLVVFSQTSSSGSPLTTKGDLFGFSTVAARLPVGANNQMLIADSAETTGLKWVNSGIGRQTIWIPAVAWTPTVSNGCAAVTSIETTAGRPDARVLLFDPSSDEHAQIDIEMPKQWGQGTLTYCVTWTSSATDTDGVAWGLMGVAQSDGDPIGSVFGTPVVVTDDNQSAAYDKLTTPESAPVTVAGSPADGDTITLDIFRDVSDANDDMTEDAGLRGVRLFYTTTAGNDA